MFYGVVNGTVIPILNDNSKENTKIPMSPKIDYMKSILIFNKVHMDK